MRLEENNLIRGGDHMSKIEVCRDVNELTPLAKIACRLFIQKCEEKGLNVRITETYRSQERQDYLYEQGRTRSGKVVTWTHNSRHTSRRAWDICKNVKGQEYSDSSFFKQCGIIAKELGITWGGTWSTPDTPHFEISTNWKAPKEDLTMSQYEELKKMITDVSEALDKTGDRITKLENPMVYNYVDNNMPDYAKSTIQKLLNKGYLKGETNGQLNLTDNMLRMLVILDRSGTFDD